MTPGKSSLPESVKTCFSINFQETYPQTAPIWFCDEDDVVVTAAIEKLTNVSADKNNVCIIRYDIVFAIADPFLNCKFYCLTMIKA
jgi:hypothetical protein